MCECDVTFVTIQTVDHSSILSPTSLLRLDPTPLACTYKKYRNVMLYKFHKTTSRHTNVGPQTLASHFIEGPLKAPPIVSVKVFRTAKYKQIYFCMVKTVQTLKSHRISRILSNGLVVEFLEEDLNLCDIFPAGK